MTHTGARSLVRLVRLVWLALMLTLASACGKGGDSDSAPSASAGPAASPPSPAASTAPANSAPGAGAAKDAGGGAGDAGASERPAPKIRHRGGMVGQVFTLARVMKLGDEERTVLDRIDEQLWGQTEKDEAVETAYKEFHAALDEGVKAGRVDASKLAPHYDTLETAASERRADEAQALNELHAALGADQRKALADMIRRRHPDPNAKPKAAPKKPAKTAKAPKAARAPMRVKKPPPKPKKSAAQIAKERAADRQKRRLARVTALLGLDAAQKQRVTALLTRYDTDPINKARRELTGNRMRALAAAFEKDEFDAAKLDLGKGPKARMQNRVAFITALLAILKPDQRPKLARTIERPTARRWGGAVVGDPGPIGED